MDPFFQRRKRYEGVLRPLGLWERFAAMPRRVQELFFQRKIPDPVLSFDETVGDTPEEREIRRAVDAGFRSARVEVDGTPMTMGDFLGVVASCMLVTRHSVLAGFDDATVRFMTEARPVLERVYEQHLQKAFFAMYDAVAKPLAAHSRMDKRLLSPRLVANAGARGKAEPRVIVSASPPEVREAVIKGIPRPVYRVGIGWASGQPRWLTLSRNKLGIPGRKKSMPVYVQAHALRRLHDRVNLPTAGPYLEAWLEDSLSKPRIVERQGARGQHLVIEYRIGKHRFGYLVATVSKRFVVVRTFKFLTMRSTPEGKRLEKRLRITRAAVDELGLHELDAFTQTDLNKDSGLRYMLKQCGCGHLFELEAEDYAAQPRALAGRLRRHLRKAA